MIDRMGEVLSLLALYLQCEDYFWLKLEMQPPVPVGAQSVPRAGLIARDWWLETRERAATLLVVIPPRKIHQEFFLVYYSL